MKNTLLVFFFSAALMFAIDVDAQAWSSKYSNMCNEWCKSVKECHHCAPKRNCGSSYQSIASLGRMYACGKRNVGRFEPNSNEKMCNNFLSIMSGWESDHMRWGGRIVIDWGECSTKRKCGRSYESVAFFYGGIGRNTSLCVPTGNREGCKRFCQRNDNCICSPKRNCGAGYTRLALFDDWSACQPKGESDVGDGDEERCNELCKVEVDGCECIKKRNCGSGYYRVMLFGDWAACHKTSRRLGSDSNEGNCKYWCKNNSNICDRCWSNRNCGKGYKRIRTFNKHRPGENWYACEKR